MASNADAELSRTDDASQAVTESTLAADPPLEAHEATPAASSSTPPAEVLEETPEVAPPAHTSPFTASTPPLKEDCDVATAAEGVESEPPSGTPQPEDADTSRVVPASPSEEEVTHEEEESDHARLVPAVAPDEAHHDAVEEGTDALPDTTCASLDDTLRAVETDRLASQVTEAPLTSFDSAEPQGPADMAGDAAAHDAAPQQPHEGKTANAHGEGVKKEEGDVETEAEPVEEEKVSRHDRHDQADVRPEVTESFTQRDRRAKRAREASAESADTTHAVHGAVTAHTDLHAGAGHREELLLSDPATREQVGQLQRLLLSLFPPSVRHAYAPYYVDADVKPETSHEGTVAGVESAAPPSRAMSAQPEWVKHDVVDDEEDEEAVMGQATELLELLESIAEDKTFVRAAWRRCQDVHQLRRQKLSKRRHQSALSRLTGSSSASQRRRQQQQQQQQQEQQVADGEDGLQRSAEDSPLDLFHFLDWDPQSCIRHTIQKSRTGGGGSSSSSRRGPAPGPSSQSPFLNAMAQDHDEYVETVKRQLGGEVVATAVPVTLSMMLPPREDAHYARYVLSSGKLRRECLEPFQFLSTRASMVREQLLMQYRQDLENPDA